MPSTQSHRINQKSNHQANLPNQCLHIHQFKANPANQALQTNTNQFIQIYAFKYIQSNQPIQSNSCKSILANQLHSNKCFNLPPSNQHLQTHLSKSSHTNKFIYTNPIQINSCKLIPLMDTSTIALYIYSLKYIHTEAFQCK